MPTATLTPGVYQQRTAPPAAVALPTGVVGFVGFAAAGPMALSGPQDIAGIADPAVSYLPQVLAGYFANGGVRCYVAGTMPSRGGGVPDGFAAALASLAPLDDIDLVATPDAMRLTAADGTPDIAAVQRAQTAALAHCAASGRRFAILDALPSASAASVTAQAQQLSGSVAEPVNGALYYPWPVNGAGVRVPPCGHVAGLYAATDAAHGVAHAPAGAALADVLDLEMGIGAAAQAALNGAGVNCLRAFPGRGIRIWGARTLSAQPEWRYVNVRRLVLTLCRWIDVNLAWAPFEPNTPPTRARVRRVLSAYLTQLWESGALQGGAAADAFAVTCDATNNTAGTEGDGSLFIDIALAPSSPAEFVVVRITLPAETAS